MLRRLILLSLLLALAGCDHGGETLRLLRPSVGLDAAIAAELEALVDRHPDLDIEIVDPPEPGMPAVEVLAGGHADLAMLTNAERYDERVNLVVPLYPSVLHILTSKDHETNQIRDLFRNSKVYAGPPGSVTRWIAARVTDDLHVPDKDFELVDTVSSSTDVIIVFAPIDREQIISDKRLVDARMFSLGTPADIGAGTSIDRATLLNPRLRAFVIPAGTYDALTPEPVVTLAVDNLLVARRDLPAALVYDLYAEIVRLRPALFGDRPELYQPLDDDLADANWAFSMHPGTLDYLRQDEPTFVERYSGVAEVLVTLVIGVISGGYALLRIYRIRRKNRIDRFYVEVIRVRDSVRPDASETEREAAIAEIRELQDRAFGMLVEERLAADESFRIFIELTNNSIERLAATG